MRRIVLYGLAVTEGTPFALDAAKLKELGVRAYRDGLGGGAIGFGKAFQVGILITLVTCAMYVIAWEITYYNFFPDFLDRYGDHVLDRMRQAGATEGALQKKAAELAKMAKNYANPLFNVGITFLEVFPVGLVVTLVSAAILRRKPGALAERPS